MKLFLDTRLLLWAAVSPDKLPAKIAQLIEDESNELYFSAASLWEIAIQTSLQRNDFLIDAHVFRRNLLDNDYIELSITSAHVVFIQNLPPIHKDPFDRILIAQATVEGIPLYTSDSLLSQYPGPIRIC